MGKSKYFRKDVRQSGYTDYSGMKVARVGDNGQARLWQVLREWEPSIALTLFNGAGVSDGDGRDYLQFLERAEYVWREPGSRKRYWLLKDTGPAAPRKVNRGLQLFDGNTGQLLEVPAELHRWPGEPEAMDSPAGKIWQAMRIKRMFSEAELVGITELDQAVVSQHIEQLASFRYLWPAGEDLSGDRCWKLPGHLGNQKPKPPAINLRLKRLYDFNRKVVVIQEEQEERGLNHG